MPTFPRSRTRIVAPFNNGGYQARLQDGFKFSHSWSQVLHSGGMDDYVTRDESRYPIEFPLDHVERYHTPLQYDGVWKDGKNISVAYQPRNQLFTDPGRLEQFAQTIDWSFYVTKLISGLNPNRPIVDIPLLVFELKDAPRMIRDLGRWLIDRKYKVSDVPDAVLSYNFGWAPLVSDVFKLLESAHQIDKRIDEIKRLQEGKSVRRKLEDATQQIGTSFVSSSTEVGKVTHHQKHEVWGVARTSIDASIALGYSPQEKFRAFYGLGPDSAHTLWNALPWSWLIDYFTNVGAVLQARRGGLSWELDACHIMWRSTLNSVSEISTRGKISTVSLSGGSSKVLYQKRRYFASPIPSFATEPFLTKKQVGMLSTLFVANILRKSRRRR